MISWKIPTKTIELCSHCHTRRITRPRQLCNACYMDPAIRDRAPNANKHHGKDENGYRRKPLPKPTDARPGTPEKAEVLRKRLEFGYELHHPEDAKLGDG